MWEQTRGVGCLEPPRPLDYLEPPDQRAETLPRVVQFINALFVGAMAIHAGLPLATMVSTQQLKKPE